MKKGKVFDTVTFNGNIDNDLKKFFRFMKNQGKFEFITGDTDNQGVSYTRPKTVTPKEKEFWESILFEYPGTPHIILNKN